MNTCTPHNKNTMKDREKMTCSIHKNIDHVEITGILLLLLYYI